MRIHRKVVAGTLLLAFVFTATAQMSKAPNPPHALPTPPAGPPAVPAPPQPPREPGTVRHVQKFERFTPERPRTIVVPAAKSEEAPNVPQIEEDLNVMSRILEKAANVAEDPVRLAMGITLEGRLFGNAGGPRNMYLEGYGAVFMMNVPFPLAAPDASQKTREPKADPNSEWEAARRELQSGLGRTFGLDLSNLALPRIGAAQSYDEEKVNELKDAILNALKNAVNIRALRPDENVVVIVTGARTEAPSFGQADASQPSSTAAPASRLLFQAKRSDLEGLQKGAEIEAIRKTIKVTLL